MHIVAVTEAFALINFYCCVLLLAEGVSSSSRQKQAYLLVKLSSLDISFASSRKLEKVSEFLHM